MPEVTSKLYKLIKANGPDAVTFLQGQLTQDLTRLDGRPELLAAMCNPKGRVLATGWLVRLDDAIGLLVADDIAETVQMRLQTYRLRAKVELTLQSAGPGVVPALASTPEALIEAGIPLVGSAVAEEFTPHMLNLDKLGAISFDKGCYTGQEVVARTEHLGKSRRRLMRYGADAPRIRAGDPVTDGTAVVGRVVNVHGSALLAVTPVELHRNELATGGVAITPQGLPYEL